MTRQLRHFILRLFLPAIALFGLATSAGNAQIVEGWRVGGFVNWGRFDYDADLRGLPGVPSCCPHYEDGAGAGFAFGGLWGLPLFSRLAWEGRISFATYNGTLSAEEYELVTSGHDTITATFGHTIELSQPALGFDALFSFETLPKLKLLGGVRTELMMGGTFHQEETILSPDNIRFENDRRQRLVYDAEIPTETPVHFSAVGGLRYEVLLNEQGTMILAPEVLFWQDFVDIVEDQRWRARGFRLGLALHYIHEIPPIPPPIAPQYEPTPPPPPPIPELPPMPGGE